MGDVASLAALALAGGFCFVEFSNFTRYRASRAESQRLFLYSALAAIILMITARVILTGLRVAFPVFLGGLRTDFLLLVPGVPQPWLATALLSFALGLAATCVSNRIYGTEKATSRAIATYGKELEKLLLTALDRYVLMSLTLKNGKVYVGWPAYSPHVLEAETEHIRILPAMSGYRRKETLEVVFTTEYIRVYEAIGTSNKKSVEQGTEKLDVIADDFEIVIPASEIISASFYSMDISQDHFKPQGGTGDNGPAGVTD